MKGIYLILGSNLGDKLAMLSAAKILISHKAGPVVKTSRIYKTAAWGIEDQPHFYNQVLEIETMLNPEFLLKTILDIEKELGRKRIKKWQERIIDIDILYYHDIILNTKHLTIPHPFIKNRRFVLEPMTEIAPTFIHPVIGLSQAELLQACIDPLVVESLPITD
ncbi:MAG: 2-amino-4-hydroxy-6-hydroxymethyldihydropteridine diphosphokinase [Cyclobacteriaceae bacterium]|nr:2-amino-4-hydroxy-6-hydroxymethyldihydropteridine diphosphokinase [Cyclobacteriaceae bacterium]